MLHKVRVAVGKEPQRQDPDHQPHRLHLEAPDAARAVWQPLEARVEHRVQHRLVVEPRLGADAPHTLVPRADEPDAAVARAHVHHARVQVGLLGALAARVGVEVEAVRRQQHVGALEAGRPSGPAASGGRSQTMSASHSHTPPPWRAVTSDSSSRSMKSSFRLPIRLKRS